MSYDIVIAVGPKDIDIYEKTVAFAKKNAIGHGTIYLITRFDIPAPDGCIVIPESSFPFGLDDVAAIHGKIDRNGWYLQQLLKLYAGRVIQGIRELYLVLDCDTMLLRPIQFTTASGVPLYANGWEFHPPYFTHMVALHSSLTKVYHDRSGICHHMMFQKSVLEELIALIGEPFWKRFLTTVSPDQYHGSGASEYELYFNYLCKVHPEKMQFRHLCWDNVNDQHFSNLETQGSIGLDYVSFHWYMLEHNPRFRDLLEKLPC